jgi:hypothetical protein
MDRKNVAFLTIVQLIVGLALPVSTGSDHGHLEWSDTFTVYSHMEFVGALTRTGEHSSPTAIKYLSNNW